MIDQAQSVVRWVQRQWSRSNVWMRIVYLLIAAALIATIIGIAPFVENFKTIFSQARPEVQSVILLFILIAGALSLIYAWERSRRVEQLKDDKQQLEVRCASAEQDARQSQERWDHLLAVESKEILWKRPCQIVAPVFVPKGQRKTRFLTILNLKGGVGKTTLSANVAGCLGAGNPPLRVLLIDIDFQGTLGNATVDPQLIQAQAKFQGYVSRLLKEETPNDELLTQLATCMNQVESARVILAEELLDTAEFELHARFLLDANADPRFRFRMHLHRQPVFELFDLVIFDCPPRVTTSVVNAALSSDYVLIPTKLDRGSIDAVPRTVGWLRSLGANCPAEVIGVVASHAAVRVGKLTSADNQSYEDLRAVVKSACDKDLLFRTIVPSSRDALGEDRGRVASLTSTGRDLFSPVVMELRERMQI